MARSRLTIVFAIAAALFGILTLLSGGMALFGSPAARAASGAVVPFVLWFNFLAGFAYIAAAYGLVSGRPWAGPLAVAIALSTLFVFAAFGVMRAMSTRNDEPTRASRPFDKDRDGFVLGEGSAMLILEKLEHALARGAKIYAEVLGHGVNSDAYHFAAPDPQGTGATLVMKLAMRNAGVTPAQVDYVNAHGTSTPLNDAGESLAIKQAFGERAYKVPISSTKSMIGHSMGAAGAFEAVACTMTLRDQKIHPTVNYETPDPVCDLDYVPNQARAARVNVTLSNSFGLGGQNACLVLGRYKE